MNRALKSPADFRKGHDNACGKQIVLRRAILLIGATVWALIRLGQIPCGPEPSHPQVLFGASVLFLPLTSAVVVWIRLRRVEGQPGGAAAFATFLIVVLGCALSAAALPSRL
jgi:hypothetical protein